MRNLAATAAAVMMAATSMVPLATPAMAQRSSVDISFGQQDRYIGQQCRNNPNWRGCRDWNRNRGNWGRNDYAQWYRWNRPNIPGSIAAGIFGFALGAAILGSQNRSDRGWDAHVQRCEARYRSYNPRTDMFLGYDGQYHRCNL